MLSAGVRRGCLGREKKNKEESETEVWETPQELQNPQKKRFLNAGKWLFGIGCCNCEEEMAHEPAFPFLSLLANTYL